MTIGKILKLYIEETRDAEIIVNALNEYFLNHQDEFENGEDMTISYLIKDIKCQNERNKPTKDVVELLLKEWDAVRFGVLSKLPYDQDYALTCPERDYGLDELYDEHPECFHRSVNVTVPARPKYAVTSSGKTFSDERIIL